MSKSNKATANPSKAANKGTRFSLVHPTARQVSLAGSFNEWDPAATPLIQSAEGEWTAILDLPPGKYEYLFVVDGQWTSDPQAGDWSPNPYGGSNCVKTVSETVITVVETVPAGAVIPVETKAKKTKVPKAAKQPAADEVTPKLEKAVKEIAKPAKVAKATSSRPRA